MKDMLFQLIGSASGWGAKRLGTQDGAIELYHQHIEKNLSKVKWGELVTPFVKTCLDNWVPPGVLTLPYIVDHAQHLAAAVKEALKNNQFPIVLGGSHAASVGSFSGAVQALEAREAMGVVWIDAHLDAHTPETSPSKAYHGMPLAALLGQGEPALVNLIQHGRKIRPEHLAVIGARSFEAEEATLLRQLGVRIYSTETVKNRGFEVIFDEALKHVAQGTQAIGISLDLDVFSPEWSPGVGSREKQGLNPEAVLPHLEPMWQYPVRLFEIVEYNPYRDKNRRTYELIHNILKKITAPAG